MKKSPPLILLTACAVAALAALIYFITPRDAVPSGGHTADASPGANPGDEPSHPESNPATGRDEASVPASPAQPAIGSATPAAAPKNTGPLIRTADGRIDPAGLADFQPMPFPGGEPAYDGEKVTAYIAVPSTGKKVALTVNQLGEFPRIQANESEQVEILLAFSTTKPGSRVALAVQDGGKLHTGKLSGALPVDDARQLAFAFTVSPNPGMHRVSATTQTGELKTLEFWAGPPSVQMSATR